jgi:hypothetical protein
MHRNGEFPHHDCGQGTTGREPADVEPSAQFDASGAGPLRRPGSLKGFHAKLKQKGLHREFPNRADMSVHNRAHNSESRDFMGDFRHTFDLFQDLRHSPKPAVGNAGQEPE